MAKNKDVDAQADYHGCTADEMRLALEKKWTGWQGFRKVRIIHGQGEVLRPELERWCRARGVYFQPEPNNPGSTFLYPTHRTLPQATLGTTLAERGLRLTPEQEAELRDPEALKRARMEAARQRQEAEKKRREDAAKLAAQRRRDEAMWEAEMARLTKIEKTGVTKKNGRDLKPVAPVVVPPSVIQYQEGYWRAEIVRVGDTEQEQLQKEKRTGLEKLAPPLPEKKKETAQADLKRPKMPQRNETADRALFEAEMERLLDPDRP